MGVSMDHFIGFTVDIRDLEIDDIPDMLLEYINEEEYCKNEGIYNELNFIPYYNYRKEPFNGKITILYDGISEEYCKLMWVIAYQKNTCSEIDEHIEKAINDIFSQTLVFIQNNVTEQLSKAYKHITNKELCIEKIKLEFIQHYH